MKRIVLTGGGSAGHVNPHFALLPRLQENKWDVYYIGSHNGIERQLVGDQIPYYPISAGKFRRYFDKKNFSDPFRVLRGFFESLGILRKIKPQIVFSKGGFVTVPVVVAAWTLRIPVILHESDLTPGLANRLSLPFAKQLCLTFPETLNYVKGKGIVTGTPIRSELLQGSKDMGLELCNFKPSLPIILVMGGSQGSAKLNKIIRDNLHKLTERYQIVHLCGQGNLEPDIKNRRYCQFEYVREELTHLLAAADIVLSRAGANAIFEILALAKPNILVPLSKEASRGDQIMNAESFSKQGFSVVIQEEEFTIDSFLKGLSKLEAESSQYIETMRDSKMGDGIKNVLAIIEHN